MEENQEGKSEKAFKNFGKKVDGFVDELHEASERLENEFKLKFEELKETAEKLKTEVKNEDRWKEVDSSLRKAGEELGNAVKAIFAKKPPKESPEEKNTTE